MVVPHSQPYCLLQGILSRLREHGNGRHSEILDASKISSPLGLSRSSGVIGAGSHTSVSLIFQENQRDDVTHWDQGSRTVRWLAEWDGGDTSCLFAKPRANAAEAAVILRSFQRLRQIWGA